MGSNRRPPESPLIATVEALYYDGTTPDPVPIPPEQGWMRFDLAPRFRAVAAEWERTTGVSLVVAAMGRSPERCKELTGWEVDGHVVGGAFDVAYRWLRAALEIQHGRSYTDRDVAEILDPIASWHLFRPLGKSRWPDPTIGQRGDWQHYQSDDYGGRRQIGPQAFAAIESAKQAIWTPRPEEYERVLACAVRRDMDLA